MGLDALRRITDLFDEGKEVVLRDGSDGKDPVLVWVNKLNSFEVDEARQDGAAARARLILALREVGTDEQALYEASLDEMRPELVREALLNAKASEDFLEATQELRVDEDWRERVAMIERQGELSDMTPEERQVINQANSDYVTELQERVAEKRRDRGKDLQGLDEQSLKERHREAWLDQQGLSAFSREYQKTQVYYALRLCSAKKVESGWDHAGCQHIQRLCDMRADVSRLPQELMDKVLTSLREQSMPVDDARFSAGAASSSASSQRPSAAEESTASGPEATSDVPVTT